MDIKKYIEPTKILCMLITGIYYFFFLFSVIFWLLEDRYISEMLSYISKIFMIVISCYLLKSSFQNKHKIESDQYKDEKRKEFKTFSKVLLLLVIIIFFISTLFFCIAWIFKYDFPVDLFDYVASPFIAILPTYLAKVLIENNAEDQVALGKVTELINDIAVNGVNTSNIGSLTDDIIKELTERKKQKQEEEKESIDYFNENFNLDDEGY